MSKYEPLWNWISENGTGSFKLTFDEIEKIAGLPIDHSFLTYTNGWKVVNSKVMQARISMDYVECIRK